MVRVLGGYQTDFARNWKREENHIVAPMTETILGALAATSLDPDEIDTIHVGNFAAELYTMQAHLGALAIEADPKFRGKPTARHEAACASGGISILAASAEIEAGRYKTALVVGIEHMKTVSSQDGGDFLGTASWYDQEAKGREYPFPKLFGQLGAEYVRRFEIPTEEFTGFQAYLADLMFRNATRNPNAQTRGWNVDVLNAPPDDKMNIAISPEIKVRDCSQITDGAVAIVLASEEYAAEYASSRGLALEDIPSILGWGHTTGPFKLEDKFAESKNDDYVLPHAHNAITQAYSRSGIAGPDDLDAYEYHDCFTTTAYASVDLVGLTPPGDNYVAIEKGWLELDGRLPLNPSGGLIGAGHPVGATGVRQALDAHRQVTEGAGDYQVRLENGRVLTVNMGGSGTTTVALVIGKS